MATASNFPPTQDTIDYGLELLPARRVTPGAVGGLAGAGNAGPEQAGALVLTYGSFAEADNAQRGYRMFAAAQHSMREAPGFLRWISFVDGTAGYGFGWWRTAADAAAWARSDVHRGFVKAQRETPFELSQFAGIWTAHAVGRRTFGCPRCGVVVDAAEVACSCGEPLDDGFAPTPAP
jgi:heme-degrading monooxygenase HmoA